MRPSFIALIEAATDKQLKKRYVAGGTVAGAGALGLGLKRGAEGGSKIGRTVLKGFFAPEKGVTSLINSKFGRKRNLTGKVLRGIKKTFVKGSRGSATLAATSLGKGALLGYGGYRLHKAIKNRSK